MIILFLINGLDKKKVRTQQKVLNKWLDSRIVTTEIPQKAKNNDLKKTAVFIIFLHKMSLTFSTS